MSVTTPILRSDFTAPEAAAEADAPADAPAEPDASAEPEADADAEAAAEGAAAEAAADGAAADAAVDAAGGELPLLQAATNMDSPATRVSPKERVRMVPPLMSPSTRLRWAVTQGSRGPAQRPLPEPT